MTSLVYGNGRFVRMTWREVDVRRTEVDFSDDEGATWHAAEDIPSAQLQPVFGNGIFLTTTRDPDAAGAFRSTDGIHWEPVSLRDPGIVGFGAGRFVRASESGLTTSRDAVRWTERSRAHAFIIGFVNFSDGQFVASNGKSVMMSSDGVAWHQAPGAGVPFPDLVDAIPFRGGLVATRVAKEADGNESWEAGFTADFQHWESGPPSYFYGFRRFGAEVFAGRRVATGEDGPNQDGVVASTSDGVNWTSGPAFDSAQPVLALSDTTLVAATSCSIKTSTDGKTWVDRHAR